MKQKSKKGRKNNVKKLKIILSVVALSLLATGCNNTNKATSETIEEHEPNPDVGNTRFEDYELSEEAKAELERVFANCYYFEIGNGYVQSFSDLTLKDIDGVVYTTLVDPSIGLSTFRETENGSGGYTIEKSVLTKYVEEGFGIKGIDFTDTIFTDEGDIIFSWGGDYGSGYPAATINLAVLDTEKDLVTVKGDALYVTNDNTIDVYNFTATMKPSDTAYFDGNQLMTFTYIKDNSGDYKRIDTSRFGEGFYKVQ